MSSGMTADEALAFLRSQMRDPDAAAHLLPLPQLVRRVRAKAHPDRHGGDDALWRRVEAAVRALQADGRLGR